MKTTFKTVDELIHDEYCPLPLEVIPNYMGINLNSVEAISWQKQDDGQLTSLTIHFIPAVKETCGCDYGKCTGHTDVQQKEI